MENLELVPMVSRMNMQLSFAVEDDRQGQDIFEEIRTFARGVDPKCFASGSVSKMLTPCCGGKKK